MLRKRRPSAKTRASEAQAADPAAALAAAVTALSQRDYCSGELAARLNTQGFTAEVIEAALEDLRARRYLDDERYAQQYVSDHAERGHGPLRIAVQLRQSALPEGLIEAALRQYAELHGDWNRLAREARIRRFGLAQPDSFPERAKQARFLQYRGFSIDHIHSALGRDELPEAD